MQPQPKALKSASRQTIKVNDDFEGQLLSSQKHFPPMAKRSIRKGSLSNLNDLADWVNKCNHTQYGLENWQEIQRGIKSDDTRQVIYGIIGLRKLFYLSQNTLLSSKIIQSQLIPCILSILNHRSLTVVRKDALFSLSMFSSENGPECRLIVDSHGIPILLGILGDEECEIGALVDVCSIIRNLALDDVGFRDKLTVQNIIPKMISMVKENKVKYSYTKSTWRKMLDSTVEVLTTVCCKEPLSEYEIVEDAVIFMAGLIIENEDSSSSNVIENCLYSISTHRQSFAGKVEPEVISKLLGKVCYFIADRKKQVSTACLKILQTIIDKRSDICQPMIQSKDFIPQLACNLKSPSKDVRLWTLVVFNTIVYHYGKNSQIIGLVVGGMLPVLVQIMGNDTVEIKQKICQLVVLLCDVKDNKVLMVKVFLQQQIVKQLMSLLLSPHPPMVIATLKCLYRVFQFGDEVIDKYQANNQMEMRQNAEIGEQEKQQQENVLLGEFIDLNGGRLIQELQKHPSQQVYQLAVRLIDNFFSVQ